MNDSREDIFIKKAISSIKENNPEDYEQAELGYRKYTDLDKWKQTIFTAVKERVVNGPEKSYL